jgi:uncharacterized damage-inducible protein DinB
MEIKQYLLDTFLFNDKANLQVLEKIKELPDKKECIRFFSHLINCQYKWMDRIKIYPETSKLDWWEPVYDLESLSKEWKKSLQPWLDLIEKSTEDELFRETKFIGMDGGVWQANGLKDIALQLNYHSIHHRAQMQSIIRSQGLTPDFVDYILTAVKKIS